MPEHGGGHGGSTTVKTEFHWTLKDEVSANLHKMEKGLHLVDHAAEHLGHKFHHLTEHALVMGAGLVGVGYGIHALGDKVFEAGKEFEETQKHIAATLFATAKWGKGVSDIDKVRTSMKMGNEEMEGIEDAVTRFATPLQDVAGAYSEIAQSVGGANVKIEDLKRLTLEATAAHKLFGLGATDAGNLVGKAVLTGMIRPAGEFGKYLRSNVGDLHKLSQPERFRRIEKAMKQLVPMGDEMAKGLGDSLFRIQETVTRLIRGVTGPLFDKVASKLDDWSKKLGEVQEHGKPLMEMYGGKLLSAFETLADVTKTLLDHWKEIAVLIGGMKVGGMLSGAAGGLGSILAGAGFGKVGEGHEAGSGLAGAFGKLAGQLSLATTGLVLFAAGLEAFVAWVDKKQGEVIVAGGRATSGGTMDKAIEAFDRYGGSGGAKDLRMAYAQLSSEGLVAGKKLQREPFQESLMASDAMRMKYGLAMGMNPNELKSGDPGMHARAIADAFGKRLEDAFAAHPEIFNPAAAVAAKEAEAPDPTKLAKPPKLVAQFGNVYITQDFKDQDPDRVFVRFKNDMESHAEKALQSTTAEVFGE